MTLYRYPWREFLVRRPDLHFTTLFGEPVVLHCHHFNLFLDQTVEDPPYIPGRRILFQNAYEASLCLLQKVKRTLSPSTPEEALEMFLELFAYLGQGKLRIRTPIGREGGELEGIAHYGYGWVRKYGGRLRRERGVDHFARGYVAAAVDVAMDLEPGSTAVEEIESPVTGGTSLVLRVQRREAPLPLRPCSEVSLDFSPTAEPGPPAPFDAEEFTGRLSEIADGLAGDERGLIEGFNVLITRHLARYYAGISADMYLAIQKTHREMVSVAQELLEESGHVCVFNTFGNLLSDPGVKAMAGGLPTPEDYVFATPSVARALGFGDWRVKALEPGVSLQMAASHEYEGLIFENHPERDLLPIFFMPGATAAAMNLAYVGKIHTGPTLTQKFYDALMLGKMGPLFGSSMEKLRHRGDSWTETGARKIPAYVTASEGLRNR